MLEKTGSAHSAATLFDFEREDSLATFWRQATPGTAYWRGYVPMRALPGQSLPIENGSALLKNEDPMRIEMPQMRGDAAIWQFLGDDTRSRIALQMQRQGVRTLMDVDDNYLRFAPTLGGKWSAWQRTHAEAVANGTGYSVEMHRKIVPMMDAMIVSTDVLADEYAEYTDNVYVCPNSVDPDDWDVSRVESENLRIGFYGSPSHARDWPLVKKALKWAARQPGVEVMVAGFTPPGFSGTTHPWADNMLAARQHLGHFDIGVAPLTRNPWSIGKSDIKGMEYAMAGVMPILQDAEPFAPWAKIGWDWMPRTEEDWREAIRAAVALGKDGVAAVAAEAKAYVLAERTIEKNIDAWREAVRG